MNSTNLTAQPAAPSIDPVSLVRQAIRASAIDLSMALDSALAGGRRRHKALDRWFGGFAAQVRRHHGLLDAVVVPMLTARGALDEPALDMLADDHAWIDDLLCDLGDALGVLAFELGAEDLWLAKAADLAAALRSVLGRRLRREDVLLTAAVQSCLGDVEREILYDEVVRAVATGPVRFSLAWLYAHISDEERVAVAARASASARLVGCTGHGADDLSVIAALG